jgi:hypothetical protein
MQYAAEAIKDARDRAKTAIICDHYKRGTWPSAECSAQLAAIDAVKVRSNAAT